MKLESSAVTFGLDYKLLWGLGKWIRFVDLDPVLHAVPGIVAISEFTESRELIDITQFNATNTLERQFCTGFNEAVDISIDSIFSWFAYPTATFFSQEAGYVYGTIAIINATTSAEVLTIQNCLCYQNTLIVEPTEPVRYRTTFKANLATGVQDPNWV